MEPHLFCPSFPLQEENVKSRDIRLSAGSYVGYDRHDYGIGDLDELIAVFGE